MAVIKHQFPGRRGADAKFGFFFAKAESGCVLFNDKRTDAMVFLGFPVASGKNNINIRIPTVGGKDFTAVENPFITFAYCSCSGAPGIRAGRIFGQGKGA